MAEFTKGPWHYDDDTATIQNDLGVAVAGINVDIDCYEANANLIAAAPDLLEAGADLLDALLTRAPSTQYPKIIQDAMNVWIAVAAKAEGR